MSASQNNGYKALANAIIYSAAESYKYILLALKHHTKRNSVLMRKKELENFFLSDWFVVLSGVNGKYLIQRMQEVYFFDG